MADEIMSYIVQFICEMFASETWNRNYSAIKAFCPQKPPTKNTYKCLLSIESIYGVTLLHLLVAHTLLPLQLYGHDFGFVYILARFCTKFLAHSISHSHLGDRNKESDVQYTGHGRSNAHNTAEQINTDDDLLSTKLTLNHTHYKFGQTSTIITAVAMPSYRKIFSQTI